MSALALIGQAGARLGLGGLLRNGLSKVGGWLFGTKLRAALTGLGIGQLLFGGGGKESAATQSNAAAQVNQYRR